LMSDAHGVLVIGAGPAGLAAAYRAAEHGLRVTVVDDNPAAGGQIWRGGEETAESSEAQAWFEKIRSVDIELIAGARVFQQPRAGTLLAETQSGVCQLNYEKLILATGARERFLPFPGWTLPNVMGAGGLQVLVKTGLPIQGKRVVVAVSGPLLLAVAAYLRSRDAEVLLIAEQASRSRLVKFGLGLVGQPDKIRQGWRLRGSGYLSGCWILQAQGKEKVERATLARGGKQWTVS